MRQLRKYPFYKQAGSVLNNKGFTLIEVIVVMAVMGIVATIATISLVTANRNAEVRSAAQEMYGQFQRAKMEAIKRNQPVAIVFDANVPGQWYQVFVDLNNDKVVNGLDQILVTINLENGIVIPAVNFGGNNETGFTPRGRASGGFGTVTINDPVTGRSFTLANSISGYVNLQ